MTRRDLTATSPVRDVMTSPVTTLRFTATIAEARLAMLDNRGSALPIVDARDRPLGILTKSDLIGTVGDDVPATVLMSKHVWTCSPETPLATAAHEMRVNRTHHLVVTDAGATVGIVSAFDLLEVVEGLGRT
jgi:CBS domain-containing protein